jgi:predicted Kef-type K+ transport protein
MDSTHNRPAVDVGAQRARPGMALLLAVLSVPGSTIAWEVPAGGLWIGLPLSVAAIVVGIRARKELAGEGGSRMAIAAIVVAALAISQMFVYLAASTLS